MPNLKISQFTNLATSAQSPTYLLPLADPSATNYKMTLNAMFSNIGANTTSGQVISTTVSSGAAVTNPGLLVTRGDGLRNAKLWITNDAAPGVQLLLSSEIVTAQGDNVCAVIFNKTNQGGGAAPASANLGYISFRSNSTQAAGLEIRSLGGTIDNTAVFYSTRQGTLSNAGIWGIDNWGTFRVSRNLSSTYSDVQLTDPTKLMVIGNVFALNDTTNVGLHILNSTGATNQLNLLLQSVSGQSTNLFECKTDANVKTLQISIAGVLSPGVAAQVDLGTTALPFKDLWLAGSSGTPASNNFRVTGTATGARVVTLPDATITVAGSASALTSGRVPFVATGGLLTDVAGFLFQTSTPNFTITAQGAAHVPILIKGAASQSANLTEWQNSAGTVLTSVSASGGLSLTALISSTATGEMFRGIGGGTNPMSFRLANTGNDVYFGSEGSTAGGFFTGSSAYGTVIYSVTPIEFIIGGTKYAFVSSAGLTLRDAANIVLGTTTGSIIATTTAQKLGFHAATPTIQRAGAAQAAVVTTGAINVAPFGYTTAAQADAIVTLVNEIRAALVEKGLIKGAA